MVHFGDGRDWFFEKRFGLFIHWGVYAIPAWHASWLNTGERVEVAVRDLPWFQHLPKGCLSLVNLPVNTGRMTGTVIKLEFDRLDHATLNTPAAFGEPDMALDVKPEGGGQG